ncbi:MAG TPA: citrate/2-methylcitrate synthase [Dehalococcoidia bacterium]|nr:citrate/2-methylcitrate synthase [Dehalococcoidia bacterium]
MPESTTTEPIARGLKGVVIDTTETSFIDGDAGKLLYRGYNIHDLAERSTFEEVSHLLVLGRLPTRAELNQYDADLKAARALPADLLHIISLARDAHPMDVLRTAVSALAAFDPDASDMSQEANLRKAVRLTAQAPTIVAAHDRIRRGQEPVSPRDDLSHAANFLYMLQGREPSPEAVRAIDVDFILHAEHGSNASAFAARVTASTLADLHAAIVSAIGTLKGPRHGGAAEAVMRMTQEIGEPENVEAYIHAMQVRGEYVMGFGHRVYKVEDPRARHMRDRARELGRQLGQPKWFQIMTRIQEVMAPLAERGVNVNVDFFAGAVYSLLGIPEDLFVPMFAIGRMPGWIAQVFEQWEDNALIRPLLQYIGPLDLEYVPLYER